MLVKQDVRGGAHLSVSYILSMSVMHQTTEREICIILYIHIYIYTKSTNFVNLPVYIFRDRRPVSQGGKE